MMAAWGLFVAVTLVIGSLPFFFGLAVVCLCSPIRLGISTARSWNRNRKFVEPDLSPRQDRQPDRKDGAMPQISQPFSFHEDGP